MRSRASSGPNEWTGALNQSGSFARHCSRNATRRGQSGQSRGGSLSSDLRMILLAEPVPTSADHARAALFVVKILVRGTGPLRRQRTLQELRVLAAFAAALALILTRRARR